MEPVLRARVEGTVLQKARRFAETEGVTVSDIVRSAVSEYLSDEKSHLRRVSNRTSDRRPPASPAPAVTKDPEKIEADEALASFVVYETFRWTDVRDPAQLALAAKLWADQDRGDLPDPIPGTVAVANPSRTDLSGFCIGTVELSLEQLWAHVDALSRGGGELLVDPEIEGES